MPFKSEAQRRYMHAKMPAMAKRWEHESRPKKGREKVAEALAKQRMGGSYGRPA